MSITEVTTARGYLRSRAALLEFRVEPRRVPSAGPRRRLRFQHHAGRGTAFGTA